MERKVSSGWGESPSGESSSGRGEVLLLLFLLLFLVSRDPERDSRAMSREKGK